VKFEDIIDNVLRREGGSSITNDSADPGGLTKYGISQRAYPDIDIKGLQEHEAKRIYFEDYWLKSKADKLPDQLKEIFFDMVVNFGVRGATKVLQRACNGKNSYNIKVDGYIGSATISACANIEPQRLTAYRVLKFANLVIKKNKFEKYWYGWFRRAIEV